MTGWFANGSHFGYLWMIPSKEAYVEDWVFQITDTSDLILHEDQGDLIPETPRVTLPVPSSHREAPKPEFLLLLRNTTRHHCLRCRLDPHVNV